MVNDYKKEDLEIVIATMHRDSLDFLVPIFPFSHFAKFSILIINQTVGNQLLHSDFPSVRVINSFEKGLSKSRNLGLQNSKGKIILLTDDDVVYDALFIEKILKSFGKYPEASAITFCAINNEGIPLKKYWSKERKLTTKFDIFRFMSIEIALNCTKFEKLNFKFDENFGLGSPFALGEENIFMFDIFQKQHSLYFVPEIIVAHPIEVSDVTTNFLQKYYSQGAFLSRINDGFTTNLFLKLFFDLKQKKLKLNQIVSAFKSALAGKNDFYKIQNECKN